MLWLLLGNLLQQRQPPTFCYKTGELKRPRYSGKWLGRFAWKLEQIKQLGHAASMRAEQPDKDRGCSFCQALEGNGILLIATKVSLEMVS